MKINFGNNKFHFCSKIKRNNTAIICGETLEGKLKRGIKVTGYTAEPEKLRDMYYVYTCLLYMCEIEYINILYFSIFIEYIIYVIYVVYIIEYINILYDIYT